MEDRDIYRVFEQVKPTGSQEEAMLERLFSEERKGRPMKLMKKTIAVLAAAALLLMTCAFAAVTGLDHRLLNYLGVSAQEEPLLSPMAVPLDIVVEDSGCTLEVKQVLADQYAALILVEFTAPEGTVLNGKQYEFGTVQADGSTSYRKITAPDGERVKGGSIFWKTLEDSDPADNHATLLYEIQPMAGEPSLLGCTVDLTLTRFYQSESGVLAPPLFSGNWSFSLTIPDKDPGRYLPLQHPFDVEDRRVQLSAIYVSPLSLTVEMQEAQDRVADIFEYVVDNWEGNISLTTVGGETIQITDTGPMFSNREGEQIGSEWGWSKDQGRFRFLPERIIDPAEIASITIFGQTFPLDGLVPVES